MKIIPETGNRPWHPPILIVEDVSSTTLSFDAFYYVFPEKIQSRIGETGEFKKLPRHIRNVARFAFGKSKKFKKYRVVNVTPIGSIKEKGGGSIALYDNPERSDLKPGDRLKNRRSGAIGVIAGKNGKLKEPCSGYKVIVQCAIKKGPNEGKIRYSYWDLDNVELLD